MALPKEPRQKMVNMMYLVLTAMLALNVSAEVLNAFKTVNTSITASNNLIGDKNNATYASFSAAKEDPQTKANAMIWGPKAEEAKGLSAEMFSYIENLKQDMKKASDLRVENGKENFKEDNLDAPTRLMDKEGKGKELYDRLNAFKQKIVAVINPEDPAFANNPKLHDQLVADIVALQKALPLDMSVPKSQSGKDQPNDAKGWTTNYFHMTPTIAALTILSKFQNDVKNSEAQVIDYCLKQIGSVKVIFDKFQAIAQSNTTYAMPGDPIEITAGIGAFSAQAQPKVYIGGQLQPLTPEGTALWKTTANGVGDKAVDVKIEYAKPDGTIATVNKVVKYTVGVPSGASVFLEKMNVMYVGVDNPITISGGSVGAEKVKVSLPAGDGSITKASGDKYIAKPSHAGLSKVIVVADGKTFEFPMRLKNLPPPTAFVGTKKSGASISSAEFKAMGGVIARYDESDFEAGFRVVSYSVSAVGGPIAIYSMETNEGNRWGGKAGALIGRAGPGTTVFFDDIKVVGPDGKERDIAPMKFTLK